MNPYRALIANDGYAATFQSLGQYRTALLEAWPSFIDLEDLADELLAPREIHRDANGHLQHPAMPSLGESVCIAEFLSAFGLQVDAVAMEDDDHAAWERYTEAENIDCSFWTPSTPAGDGWVLLEIFESDDGPSALYARRKPHAPHYSRRTAPSPFTAKVTRVRRHTGELVVQLGHQAPDRMYPGTTVSLHWPAVPGGYALVPAEPRPEIIAAAAAAAWPVASKQDMEIAGSAARLVLMTMDAAPGATLESIAAAIATMVPAYRAMIGAALRASKEAA